jgi:hypothetical protein
MKMRTSNARYQSRNRILNSKSLRRSKMDNTSGMNLSSNNCSEWKGDFVTGFFPGNLQKEINMENTAGMNVSSENASTCLQTWHVKPR